MMKKNLLPAIAILATVFAVGTVQAEITARQMKLGIQNPKGHPMEVSAKKLAETIAAKSGNKIKIRVFSGGQLGGDLQTISALQGGVIEMTVLNSGILGAQVKDFEIYDFPFIFENNKEVDAVLDGDFGQERLAVRRARGQQRKQIALFVGVVQRAGHVKIAQHAFQRGDHHRGDAVLGQIAGQFVQLGTAAQHFLVAAGQHVQRRVKTGRRRAGEGFGWQHGKTPKVKTVCPSRPSGLGKQFCRTTRYHRRPDCLFRAPICPLP